MSAATGGRAAPNLTSAASVPPAVHARSAVQAFRLAAGATTCVMLAFMPFLGRAGALSEGASQSRVAELLLLTIAAAFAVRLRGRRLASASPGAVLCLATVVAVFSIWAMVTCLQGPLMAIGIAKAVELLAVTFIAFQVVSVTRSLRPWDRRRVADLALLAIVVTVLVLVLANLFLYRAPLPVANVTVVGGEAPLSTTNDWLDINQRPRLLLGMNHPLASALMLAFGVMFCINATFGWPLKMPILLSLGWLLHLCDARGIEAGGAVGLAVALFCNLPRSPYKTLLATLSICGVAFVLATLILAGHLDDLVVRFAGSDAFTLNSRVDLWKYALALVPDHPLLGVGYFSTRVYLLSAFPFAGHAHNSAIEVLLSTGVIGLTLFAVFLGLWVYALIATGDPLLIGVSPIVLSEGSLNPILFTPGVGMFLMLLIMFNALFVPKAGVKSPRLATVGLHTMTERQPATIISQAGSRRTLDTLL